MFSFHRNGVIHSTTFSAIAATTRNRDLDGVCLGEGWGLGRRGESDGEEGKRRLRLRFGALVEREEMTGRPLGESKVGFGVAEKVVTLRKGGRYV